MHHRRRVHLVPVRDARDAVVDPLVAYDADAAHLLADPGADVDALETDLEDAGVAVESWRVDLEDLYAVLGLVTTLADAHADDDTYANVSAGTPLSAVAAALGCMDVDTDATAYHVRGDGSVAELPTYPIGSPSTDGVTLLLLVAVEDTATATPAKRTLIDRAIELGFALEDFPLGASLVTDYLRADPREDRDGRGFRHLSTSDKKGAYRRLDAALDPLVERGYVTVEEVGRRRQVSLTDRGRDTLRAFRHEASAAVDYLDGVPDWLDDPAGTGGTLADDRRL